MAIERIAHTNLKTDSPPFLAQNGGSYLVTVSGLVAGGDQIELQMFNAAGQPTGLPDGIRFSSFENGATRRFTVPAGTQLKWKVPSGLGAPIHSMTSNIVSAA